jgi:undecaprenyl diphosphate synthase
MSEKESKQPNCVGFIMDGNRRFATELGKSTLEGHKAGEAVFYDSVSWVKDAGIKHAVYYAFSTENWKRSPEEVSYLMKLFELFIKRMLNEIHQVKVGVKVIGQRKDFSPKLQKLIDDLETESAEYKELTVWVALSYGGRAEIVEAANRAVLAGEEVTEESFTKMLWTADMPDPDLVIRTGGEQRLSNFLPWQSVYSELFFTDTYWPAFTKEEFTRILSAYADRERRQGK